MSTPTELPPYPHDTKFTYTLPPNPSFTLGQKVEETEHGKAWVDACEGEGRRWEGVDCDEVDPKCIVVFVLLSRSSTNYFSRKLVSSRG